MNGDNNGKNNNRFHPIKRGEDQYGIGDGKRNSSEKKNWLYETFWR